jgi:hypothetical protein
VVQYGLDTLAVKEFDVGHDLLEIVPQYPLTAGNADCFAAQGAGVSFNEKSRHGLLSTMAGILTGDHR